MHCNAKMATWILFHFVQSLFNTLTLREHVPKAQKISKTKSSAFVTEISLIKAVSTHLNLTYFRVILHPIASLFFFSLLCLFVIPPLLSLCLYYTTCTYPCTLYSYSTQYTHLSHRFRTPIGSYLCINTEHACAHICNLQGHM